MTKPKYLHDCERCEFLGQTIGGGRIHDLYVHRNGDGYDTIIARYGDSGPEYYSSLVQYAQPGGHAELFVAAAMLREKDQAK